jgi:AhpD family alkylhydroperoxidase
MSGFEFPVRHRDERRNKMTTIQQRMKNPVMVLPDVLKALYSVASTAKKGDVPSTTLLLVQLRASQVNGCSYCVDMHSRELREAGEVDERLFAVAAWHESPYFNEAERAALALTEAVTRLNDRADAVPDEIWEEATRHYDEQALSVLIINIALINFWNRINVPVRQVSGFRPQLVNER